MATKPPLPSLDTIFGGHPPLDQSDVAYSNVLDSGEPTKARRANVIGRDIGIPGATVSADVDGFGQEQHNNQTLNILGTDPHIASFLVDPHTAASVKDDLPAFRDISALLKLGDSAAGKKGWDNYLKHVPPGGLMRAITLTDRAPPPDYKLQPLTGQELTKKLRPITPGAQLPEPLVPKSSDNELPPSVFDMLYGVGTGTLGSILQSTQGAESFIADTLDGGAGSTIGDYLREDVAETQPSVDANLAADQAVYNRLPYPAQQAYSAVQSIATMGAAVLTDNPIAFLGLQQGLQQYQQVRDRGGSANEALLSGTVSGAAESGFEKYFGLGWMLGNFGKKATSKFVGGLLLREVPSEMATTAVQDLADAMVTGGGGWEGYKQRLPGDLLNTAASTALMVAMMGGGHHIARQLAPQARAMNDIERAAAGSQFVDELMAAAEKSKTKAEDPQTLKEFVEHRTQDSPVRNLYLPVEAAVQYMQSEKYAGELDQYKDQIAQAQATQGDVVIPIGDAVATLSGTPAWDALKEDIRIEPGGLSRKEAVQQHSEIIDQLEKRGKEIAAQVDEKQGQLDAAGEVYAEVKNRLRIAGVDDKQADAVAQIYAARYEARAARLGGTPMEQFKRSKITFPGEAVGQFEGGREVAQQGPLEGLPRNIKVGNERVEFGPHATAREAAQAYMKRAGLPYNPPRTYVRVDPARAARIAQAFEDMRHNPNDPAVKAAYGALKKETVAQWRAIEKTGLKVEFIKGKDPYGNPRNAILDVVNNNHLWVYPTDSGFGSSDTDVSDNPLLGFVPGVEIDGQKVRYNDLFRIVHDYFGHIKEGVGFRADGEENAWRIHSAMFSPLARRALTTETRGQNSWVNFGPHGVANQTASSEDTVYADQKIGLLPDWAVTEGADDERTLNQDASLLGWQGLSQHLTDEEKENLREASKQKILSLVETLPDAKEMAAAAVAGRAKRGWYEQSAQAILDVFGAGDAPRFAALLAALSPQTSVESNLYNALKTWTLWNNEGRPTDRRSIVDILGRSVQGGKGVGSILTAWINNSVTALTAPTDGMKLSGPKVDSFASNLMGAVDEVTNDTWMANFAGVSPETFKKTGQNKGPGYKAMNAVTRRAADILTKKTGQTWTPAEVQETVWSFAKTLYEMRDRAGETRTMRQLLEAGHLTHADIANTPDFAALFTEGVFRTILEQGGYGDQIAAVEGRGRPSELAGEGRITDAAETGFSQRDLTRFLNRAADRLEEVRARRQANARTLRQDVLPEAGWTPERVSGLIDQFGNEDGSSSAIAVMMSPDEYLAMNASAAGREMIAQRVAEMEQYGGKLDVQRLSDSPPIYLGVALGGPNDTRPPPMVRGHDGRHRMELLRAAGVARVPVIVSLTDKDGKPIRVTEPMKVSNIIPNRSRSSQMDTGDRVGEVSGIPISFKYQDKLAGMGQRVLFQSADDVFYSALERTVANAPQEKASAEQWKALLTPGRTPGIKSEEIEWSGIHDWLDMQKGPVSKDALLHVIRDNGIKVEETVLGRSEADMLADYGYTVADLEDPEHEANLIVADSALNAQFRSWSSDPSNIETYRELLLTLPLGVGSNPDRAPSTHWDTEGVVAHMRFMDKLDAEGKKVLFIEEVQSDWHQKGRDQGYETKADPEKVAAAQTELEKREQTLFAAERALMVQANKIADKMKADTKAGTSDYSRIIKAYPHPGIVEEGERPLQLQLDRADKLARYNPFSWPLVLDSAHAWQRAKLAVTEAEQALQNAKQPSGIPEAPFKSSWPALVMKRAIRWAVDNGYDKVAWTTGEEQASRYNLSSTTGPITVERAHEQVLREGQVVPAERIPDAYLVSTRNGNAMETIRQQYNLTYSPGSVHRDSALKMTADQMREVFGNDLGGQLIEAAENAPSYSNGASAGVTLADADLRVGGEGMKAFYDRNLVNITNDIIKKYGAKVGQHAVTIKAGADNYIVPALENARRQLARDNLDDIDRRHWEKVIEGYERDIAKNTTDHPGFEITPKLREAASGGFSLFQGERGSTTFTDDGAKLIQLFSSADRSTLLHETGHIWLEELKADAADDPASAKDWETVKKWFAANGHEVGKADYIPTDAHEIWARGVERYFMEGKSPTVGLAGVFRTFKSWLLRIYGVVQNLQTPITPEVREVMDRLIATQDAIDDAHRMNNTAPLFKTAEEAGMTDAEFADYQKRVADARDEAYDALLYKTMESIRKRKAGEMRDARASVRSEVAEMVNKQPQFRLLHLLRTGRWLGEPERPAVDVKLNTGWLIDNFGEGILDKLPRGPQIWSGKGETGDTIAEMVGLGSGSEVVHTLVGMRTASDELRASGETRSMRDKLVSETTDRIMSERHGDPLNDGTIEEEAIAAINSARQGEIIASEARQLSKRTHVLGTPTPYQFAREWARRTVAEGHVRDVASRAAMQRYIRAANKAAKAAEEAILKGDIDEAYRQKQAQLLNHALLVEAKAAADRIDRIITKLKKLAGRSAQKSIDPEYFDKIQSLLENYDFKPRSQRSIDEQVKFQAWLEAQRAKGFEVHVPPRLANNGTPYTRVSVQELESLGDLVDSLVSLGRKKQKLVLAGKERDFSEFRDLAVARLKAMADRKLTTRRLRTGFRKENTPPINDKGSLLSKIASDFVKVEKLAEFMDGGPTGPFNDLLTLGARAAENMRHQLRQEVMNPLGKAYKALGHKHWARLHDRVTIPELTWNTLNEGDPRLGTPVTITRSELLAIFMNMGNLSNLEKLSRGERWNVDVLKQVMDRELTKEDLDFAQTLWDAVEKLWPHIVSVEREMSGVAPEKVVDNPIETRHGTYRGGYWPVVYDPSRWQVAEDLEGKQLDDMFGLKSGVATQKGHTIARTGAFGPINLSLERVLFNHVEQVVTRAAYAPFARDVLRAIRDKSIRGWMDTKLGPEFRKQIEPWLLQQINAGAVNAKAARWWEKVLRQFRINTQIAAMGFRHTVLLAQSEGLLGSADRIGARWVATGLKQYALHPVSTVRFVLQSSDEMRNRNEAFNREAAEMSARMRGKHSWFTTMQNVALAPIGWADRYTVSIPTWMGAYMKGTSEGMNHSEAVEFADKNVRMSQGAGTPKDLAGVQARLGEGSRFFTMFYSPFNVMFNQQWAGIQAMKDPRQKFMGVKGSPVPLLKTTFYWVMLTAMADAMLHGDWPDFGDAENLEKWFARNVFFGLWAGIPIMRDLANWGNQTLGGQYAGDPGSTPVGRTLTAITKATKDAVKWEKTGEAPKAPIKEVGNTVGVVAGVPTSQAGAAAQFLWDVHHGEQNPQSVSDWYFGLTKGKVPKPKSEAAQ